MTFYEWLLVGLALLAAVLVCVAAGAYYGKRPDYPSTMTVYSAKPDIEHRPKHGVPGEGMSTQRLNGRPMYPDNPS